MNAQWHGYKSDRDNGMTHEQIVADGVYDNPEELALRYSQMLAIQADYMRRAERDSIGDQDPYARFIKAGD